MSIAFEDAWYVAGDDTELLFAEKMAAEIWARKLFPQEDEDQRYARIYYRRRQKTLITVDRIKEMTR